MNVHKHFVQSQMKTYFSREKKKYPLIPIALATMLHIPDETITDLPVLSITGQHYLRIDNYLTIRIYETDQIMIVCKNMTVTISGKYLKIEQLNQDNILVRGYIQEIKYQDR